MYGIFQSNFLISDDLMAVYLITTIHMYGWNKMTSHSRNVLPPLTPPWTALSLISKMLSPLTSTVLPWDLPSEPALSANLIHQICFSDFVPRLPPLEWQLPLQNGQTDTRKWSGILSFSCRKQEAGSAVKSDIPSPSHSHHYSYNFLPIY